MIFSTINCPLCGTKLMKFNNFYECPKRNKMGRFFMSHYNIFKINDNFSQYAMVAPYGICSYTKSNTSTIFYISANNLRVNYKTIKEVSFIDIIDEKKLFKRLKNIIIFI